MSLKFKCGDDTHYLVTRDDLDLNEPTVFFPWSSEAGVLPDQASSEDVEDYKNPDGNVYTQHPDTKVWYQWTSSGWVVVSDPTPVDSVMTPLVVADDVADEAAIVALIEAVTFNKGVEFILVQSPDGTLVGLYDLLNKTWLTGPLMPGTAMTANDVEELITLNTQCNVKIQPWTAVVWPPGSVVCHEGTFYENQSDTDNAATFIPPDSSWTEVTGAEATFASIANDTTDLIKDLVANSCTLQVDAWQAGTYAPGSVVCVDGVFYANDGTTDTDLVAPAAPWVVKTDAEAIFLLAQEEIATLAQDIADKATSCSLKIDVWQAGTYDSLAVVCVDGVFYANDSEDTTTAVPPAAPWVVKTTAEVIAILGNPPITTIDEPIAYTQSLSYNYTGVEAKFTIPEDVLWLKITAKGPGSPTSIYGVGGMGNQSGKETTVFEVQVEPMKSLLQGEEVTIIVGDTSHHHNATAIPCAIGFGEEGRADASAAASGAGLTGVFLGGAVVTKNDNSRALTIAGGAGGMTGFPYTRGKPGNATAHLAANMEGTANPSLDVRGGNGGGYLGGSSEHITQIHGAMGFGGSNFSHPDSHSHTSGIVPFANSASLLIEWETA